MQFIVWYKKIIEAEDIKEAIQKEDKVKPQLYSIEGSSEEKKQDCIGFKYS